MKLLDESLLTDLPPFRRLQRPQIRDILDAAVPKRLESGQTFFNEDDEATHFFLLLDGHARVMRTTADGDQVILLHIPSGQLFGIAAALGKDRYPATAMAVDECLALCWPQSRWAEFADKYDGFATETYRNVGERLGEMNTRIIEIATQQVEQRVANALLRMVRQTGRKVEDGVEVDFPVTRQNISDMTGTTLHTVSRLLSAWEKDGIVRSRRRRITILKPHELVLLGGAQG